MRKVYLLWRCDMHHTQDSKRLLYISKPFDNGLVSTIDFNLRIVINHCQVYSESSSEGMITDYDKKLLFDIEQTQGREENYIIEMVSIDTILEKV